MNNRIKLQQAKTLLNRVLRLITEIEESQETPDYSKPNRPDYGRRFERKIWDKWDELAALGPFTASKAQQIVTGKRIDPLIGPDSMYSQVLSNWARMGCIELVSRGQGQTPSFYRIHPSPKPGEFALEDLTPIKLP